MSNQVSAPKGAVSVIVAMLMTVLIGFAALAVDTAYVFLIKNELQNAADAAALAGAGALYNDVGGPDWDRARSQAERIAQFNKVARESIRIAQIEVGYFSEASSGSGGSLLLNPERIDDAAAVRVTVSKSEGNNAGPIRPFFAAVIGTDQVSIGASATGVVRIPSSANKGELFPFIMSKCVYDNFWNSNAIPPQPKLDPKTNAPFVFVLSPTDKPNKQSKSDPICTEEGRGVWTTFQTRGGASEVRSYITEGNPDPLKIGDNIWVESGVQATNYGGTRDCSAAGSSTCAKVSIPVVENLYQRTNSPIIAFSCLNILNADQGAKTVTVQLTRGCTVSGGGGGTDLGARTPPRLAQ
jgi:Flp pilus assembly protein TadG